MLAIVAYSPSFLYDELALDVPRRLAFILLLLEKWHARFGSNVTDCFKQVIQNYNVNIVEARGILLNIDKYKLYSIHYWMMHGENGLDD